MTVLVTGAAGFIGYHVADALVRRGETVVGLDNLDPYYSVSLKRDRLAALAALDGAFRFVPASFADGATLREALRDTAVTRIVHLGAQPGVRYSLENPGAYVAANLAGHLNILELARERGVAHLVYASSSSVYGAGSALPFRVEDRADQPVSLYAATKRADELMSHAYAHLFALPQTGLRFFTVYGPWGRPDMALWLWTDAILRGAPIRVFNDGLMRRDFTFVADVVAGVLAALDRPPAPNNDTPPHRLYNIGNNRSEPLERVIALVEAACGRSATREMMALQPGDLVDTAADITTAQADLNFHPTVTVDEGVPRFVSWFRRYHNL